MKMPNDAIFGVSHYQKHNFDKKLWLSLITKFLDFSFTFYCYENNSLTYFYCNWLKSWVQISERSFSWKMCHDITNFEAYCSWWAFPAWWSPTISLRKPGKKQNQIDVRLQCNTPKKKLRLFYYMLNIFSFGTLKFMKTCPVTRFLGTFLPRHSSGFLGKFCPA